MNARAACLILLCSLAGSSLVAQRPQTRQGFWISFGWGYGSAAYSCDSCTATGRAGALTGNLRMGGTVSPHVLLGGESNGWLRPDSAGGRTFRGLATFSVFYYPAPERGHFLGELREQPATRIGRHRARLHYRRRDGSACGPQLLAHADGQLVRRRAAADGGGLHRTERLFSKRVPDLARLHVPLTTFPRPLSSAALAIALAAAGCGDRSRQTPPDAKQILAAEVGLSDSALAIIREIANGLLGELHPVDSNGTVLTARGVSFGLAHAQVAGTIARLRERLGPGHLVFVADRGYGMTPDSIGVIASSDQFDILRVRSTDGINYDITADSVQKLARRWHDQYGLEITGAALDWFEARILRPPADYTAFANELYAVCPDIVTQGTNTVAALIVELRRNNMLYCWWD